MTESIAYQSRFHASARATGSASVSRCVERNDRLKRPGPSNFAPHLESLERRNDIHGSKVLEVDLCPFAPKDAHAVDVRVRPLAGGGCVALRKSRQGDLLHGRQSRKNFSDDSEANAVHVA